VDKQKNNCTSRPNPNLFNPLQSSITRPHLYLNGLIPQLALVDVAFNLYIHFIDCGHFAISFFSATALMMAIAAAFLVRNAMSQIMVYPILKAVMVESLFNPLSL
jgi:hypothetical protein